MRKMLLAIPLALVMVFAAYAASYSVPAGTTETVTSDNAATYNAYDEGITVPATAGLDFSGPGTMSFTPMLTLNKGASVVSNGADVALGSQQIWVNASSTLTVTNATMRRAMLPGDVAAINESLIVYGGDMVIEEGAVVSNRFNIGYNWAAGRVVQNGGTVVNIGGSSGTQANWPKYGNGSGSYYELRGGTHEIWGSAHLGKTSYGGSVFAMYGGTLKQTARNS